MQVNPDRSTTGTQYSIQTFPGYGGTAGQKYTASIWVRAYNSLTVGHVVTVGLSEAIGSGFSRGMVVQSPNANVTLTLAWQKVTVALTQKNAGDVLTLYASSVSQDIQESFLVDNASLTAG
jgi:hypothetical protein